MNGMYIQRINLSLDLLIKHIFTVRKFIIQHVVVAHNIKYHFSETYEVTKLNNNWIVGMINSRIDDIFHYYSPILYQDETNKCFLDF